MRSLTDRARMISVAGLGIAECDGRSAVGSDHAGQHARISNQSRTRARQIPRPVTAVIATTSDTALVSTPRTVSLRASDSRTGQATRRRNQELRAVMSVITGDLEGSSEQRRAARPGKYSEGHSGRDGSEHAVKPARPVPSLMASDRPKCLGNQRAGLQHVSGNRHPVPAKLDNSGEARFQVPNERRGEPVRTRP